MFIHGKSFHTVVSSLSLHHFSIYVPIPNAYIWSRGYPISHLVEMPAKKQLSVNVMLVGQLRSGLHNKRTRCSVQERLHQKMKYSLQQAYFWNIDEASSSFWERRDICNKMRNAMLFEKWSSLMHWCKLFAVAAALSALPPNATHLPKISVRRGAGRKVVLYFMFLHY